MRLPVLLLTVISAALVAAPVASAAAPPKPYTQYSISANAAPVAGLPGATGYPRAQVLVPSAWKVTKRSAGRITLRTDKRTCPYLVTFSVRFAAGPAGSAADHVTAALPAATPAYVMDSGVRRAYAWRVVRQPDTQRLDGLQAVASTINWAGLPSGQTVWNELRASAPKASASVGCHSGFYREVARQIGDALAVNTRIS